MSEASRYLIGLAQVLHASADILAGTANVEGIDGKVHDVLEIALDLRALANRVRGAGEAVVEATGRPNCCVAHSSQMIDAATQEKRSPSTTAVAVAVVALARFMATTNPALGTFLAGTLESAVQAGLNPGDLELLRTLVESFS